MSKEQKQIERQHEFVKWQQDRKMYNQFETGDAMQKMHNVWEEGEKEIERLKRLVKSAYEEGWEARKQLTCYGHEVIVPWRSSFTKKELEK